MQLLNHDQVIQQMTLEQKDKLILDLLICISQDRLLDNPNGWHVAATCNDGVPLYRPNQLGGFGTHHDVLCEGGAPTWTSLPEGYRRIK